MKKLIALFALILILSPNVSRAEFLEKAKCLWIFCEKNSTVINQTANQTSSTSQSVVQGGLQASTSVSTSFTTEKDLNVTLLNWQLLTDTLVKNSESLRGLGQEALEALIKNQSFWQEYTREPPLFEIKNINDPLRIESVNPTQIPQPLNVNVSQTTPPFLVRLDQTDRDLLLDAITSLKDAVLTINSTISTTTMPFPSPSTGQSISKSITQTAHGFVVGDWVYLSGASTYAKTDNDTIATSDGVGVVSTVTDANTFTVTTFGYVTGLSGLTAGSSHFLSSTAGAITATEPSGPSQTRKPVLIADTATSGWVIDRSGTPVTGSTAVAVTYTSYAVTTSASSLTTVAGLNVLQPTTAIFPISTGTVTNGGFNTSGNAVVAPVSGTYNISASYSAANNSVPQFIGMQIVKNGTTIVSGGTGTNNQTSQVGIGTVQAQVFLSAGDTIDFRGTGSSGTSISYTSYNVSISQVGGSPVPMSLAGEYGSVNIPNTSTFAASLVTIPGSSFTIPSAGTWRVGYNINYFVSGTNQNSSIGMYDGSGALVANSYSQAFTALNNEPTIANQTLFVTTSGPATYSLKGITTSGTATIYNSTGAQLVSGSGSNSITYEKISGFTPTSGQSVDYVNVRRAAANYVTTSGTGYRFDTVDSGNIPYDSTTGNFTLTAGKTYRLEGEIQFNQSNAQAEYRWFNVTAGTAIGNNSLVASADAAAANSSNPHALAIITPSVTTLVQLRPNFSSNTNANANYSYAQVTQLGSSAITYPTVNRTSLATQFTSTTHGAFVDVTGMTMTVPAGTWDISYALNTSMDNNGTGFMIMQSQLVDTTNGNAIVANSKKQVMTIGYATGFSGTAYGNTYFTTRVSLPVATSYKIQVAKVTTGGTPNTAQGMSVQGVSNSAGEASYMEYKQAF